MFVIGLPSFILTFQPNSDIIRGNFIPQVLKKSIPSALLLFINVLIVVLLNANSTVLTPDEFTTLSTLLVIFTGFINLVWTCWPLNLLRWICITLSFVLIVGCIWGMGMFFAITTFSLPVIITLSALLLSTILLIVLAFYIKEWYFKKKYGTVSYSNTTETEFDKRFNKLLSKFNKKKKKDFVEFDKEETEELLENLKASGN